MINSLDHLIVAVSDINLAEKNYTKVFGIDPVWRGEHKELGTENCLFNFENTYFELLAAKGDGLGAALVNYYLQESGEGLIGVVLGTKDLEDCYKRLQEKGYMLGEISDGEGVNFKDGSTREWKNLFLPPELTRGIFAFIIQHTKGNLEKFKGNDKSVVSKLDHVVIQTNDAAFQIHIGRIIQFITLARNTGPTRSGIKPDIHSIGSFLPLIGFSLVLFGKKVDFVQLPPSVTALFGKNLLNVVECTVVQENLISCFLVVKDRNRDTPRALTRNTPITASNNERVDTILSNLWNPLNLHRK